MLFCKGLSFLEWVIVFVLARFWLFKIDLKFYFHYSFKFLCIHVTDSICWSLNTSMLFKKTTETFFFLSEASQEKLFVKFAHHFLQTVFSQEASEFGLEMLQLRSISSIKSLKNKQWSWTSTPPAVRTRLYIQYHPVLSRFSFLSSRQTPVERQGTNQFPQRQATRLRNSSTYCYLEVY